MATTYAKPNEVVRQWVLIDCAGQTVGRLATRIANILRGKHRPTYTPHADAGDFVVAINAAALRFTGNKWADKRYWRHSGYPGGISSKTAAEVRASKPEALLEHAVKGMLPKNFAAQRILKKLKIYPGAEHPHQAQLTSTAS